MIRVIKVLHMVSKKKKKKKKKGSHKPTHKSHPPDKGIIQVQNPLPQLSNHYSISTKFLWGDER